MLLANNKYSRPRKFVQATLVAVKTPRLDSLHPFRVIQRRASAPLVSMRQPLRADRKTNMADDTVWVDGVFVSSAQVSVALDALSLQFGLGLSEDVRAYRRTRGELVVFRLLDHVERLLRCARMLQLSPRWSAQEIAEACLETVRRNGSVPGRVRLLVLPTGTAEDASAVPTADSGADSVRVVIQCVGVLSEPPPSVGLHATFSSFVRPHPATFANQSNVFGNRTPLLLAHRAALQSGFGAALQFDAAGYVAGAAHANLFCVNGQRLVTPGGVDGTFVDRTREAVIVLAEEAGYYVDQGPTTREQVLQSEEVFLTSTQHEIQPVVSIDRISIGAGVVGPVTARLTERFAACTRGTDSNHPEWLSLV
jgi:branched-chain amino acid aminotransferase